MLVDPLPMVSASSDANLGTFRATDFAPGASTRVQDSGGSAIAGSLSRTLRVSHANSKENPGVNTVRTLIRLDDKYVGADGDGNPVLEKPSTASVQMVITKPDDGVLSTAALATMVKGFLASFFASGTEATYDTIKAALDTTYLTRVLNGEA